MGRRGLATSASLRLSRGFEPKNVGPGRFGYGLEYCVLSQFR
jgi:hypothetical protein